MQSCAVESNRVHCSPLHILRYFSDPYRPYQPSQASDVTVMWCPSDHRHHWNSVLGVFSVTQSPVRSNQTFHQPQSVRERIWTLLAPWPARAGPGSPLRSQELAAGFKITVRSTIIRGGGGGGAGRKRYKLLYSSFKWGLKTGHFYRFIRTFRTS